MLTQARLKQLLRYNKRTGAFHWKVARPGSAAIGSRAGSGATGYWRIKVDGQRYAAHRLAWLYVYGCFPSGILDHKNRERLDCRIAVLREATRAQNNWNSDKTNAASGLKGAYWRKDRHKWAAAIKIDGHVKHIGYFPTAEAAHAAYQALAKELHGEFFYRGTP